MRLLAPLLAVTVLAGSAAAQVSIPIATLSIASGETVTVRILPDGHFVQLSRGPHVLATERADPDTIVFSFFAMPRGQTALFSITGDCDAISYRIRSVAGDQMEDRGIASTLPGSGQFEIWRESLDRIELSELRRVTGGGDQHPGCG